MPPNPKPRGPVNIKSAARKLPYKRREPQPQPSSPPRSSLATTLSPHPPPIMPAPIPGTTSTTSMATREEEGGASRRRQRPGSSPASEARRVSIPPDLSESAEIDSSRGLLGCARSQASSSPDLNIFYEPLLESLPAALHRSQLSEKAPRLRKKFRGSSRRVARGQDPNRPAPHDRGESGRRALDSGVFRNYCAWMCLGIFGRR
ncbi:LOW QUALITY PROTEIN: uncharacterized protein LOC109834934 [Asparagus officinalis]|uniref:LOW QUALITY PROTEIN: uncharacterized protein LOC109834934 n=1 Tax=Asparagus officinalis TaxID=4686 RepID=UPI00098E62F6|nr:LOW QUALITY PROTEIN: uncharacterized protein LOC109834934 [Asparagus officinalis]